MYTLPYIILRTSRKKDDLLKKKQIKEENVMYIDMGNIKMYLQALNKYF